MTARAAFRALAVRLGLTLAGVALALGLGEALAPASTGGFSALVQAFGRCALVPDLMRGYRARPGADCEVGGVPYRFSAWGTRGETPPGAARGLLVLALGDSMTMGWGVPQEAAWPASLAARLRRRGLAVPVVNAGLVGYGTWRELATWDALEPRLQALAASGGPRLAAVVLGYFPNDPEPLAEGVGARGPGWSRLWRWAAPRLRALGTRLGLLPTAAQHYEALHAPGSPAWARQRAAFDALAARCEARRVPCVVAVLPPLTPTPGWGSIAARVVDAARGRGLGAVDLTGALARARGAARDPRVGWVAPDDPHPDASVHAAYARALAPVVAEVLARGEPAPVTSPSPAGPGE